MKLEKIRLLQEPDKSFIVFYDNQPFAPWHHHPEYELVLVTKGKGKRMVGDHIDRFEQNDLLLIGPYLPHMWLCDQEYLTHPDGFQGECIVYHFIEDFLGSQFFDVPENRNLQQLLAQSTRGVKFFGKTKEKIITLILKNYELKSIDRLYSLLSIFHILSKTKDYTLLTSPGFMEPFHSSGNEPMQKALEYIVQHLHEKVTIKEMLNVTNMSNSAFCVAFKKNYRMTFKEYLLNLRIGYACKLLTEASMNISQIAYNCGFENMSNFNRYFKKLKGMTPSDFQLKANGPN
jgi:AraC-like DNA-binding protein